MNYSKQRLNVIFKIFIYILAIGLFTGSRVFAHKVMIFAEVKDGKVYTESWFNGGKKVKNATIEVYDNNSQKMLLNGKTDNNGNFSFVITKYTDLKIVLNASMGHRNHWIIKKEELIKGKGQEKAKTDIKFIDILYGIGCIAILTAVGLFFKRRSGFRFNKKKD